MKLVDLKCPSCGGKLEPSAQDANRMVCEYCGSSFVLDDEKQITYHVHQYVQKETEKQKGTGKTGLTIFFAIMFLLFFVLIAIPAFGIGKRTAKLSPALDAKTVYGGLTGREKELAEDNTEEKVEIAPSAFAETDWDLKEAVASAVRPEEVKELCLKDVDSLEGIEVFVNLEKLTLQDVQLSDFKGLIPLKNLKELYIEDDYTKDSIISTDREFQAADYSALAVLTGLERLHIESEAIRDFSFLTALSNLTELSLEETDAISMEPLADLPSLTVLKLADNSEIRDYKALESMTGLRELSLNKGTDQPDPDLAALTQLTDLDICGFLSLKFLRNMPNLKNLSIHGCNVDEIDALSGLVNLEHLTCYSVWTYNVPLVSLDFVDAMPNLLTAHFCGKELGSGWGAFQNCVEVYGDISNVFNHPNLQELYLNNCTFELDTEKLVGNPSLKKLELKEIKLKVNSYVETSGGFTDIWYDDMVFDENTQFLSGYPNLEELYLDGNQLTDISFAASLKKLTHLGLADNYITDLSPLNQAENLKWLDISENPITETINSSDDVEIIS